MKIDSNKLLLYAQWNGTQKIQSKRERERDFTDPAVLLKLEPINCCSPRIPESIMVSRLTPVKFLSFSVWFLLIQPMIFLFIKVQSKWHTHKTVISSARFVCARFFCCYCCRRCFFFHPRKFIAFNYFQRKFFKLKSNQMILFVKKPFYKRIHFTTCGMSTTRKLGPIYINSRIHIWIVNIFFIFSSFWRRKEEVEK